MTAYEHGMLGLTLSLAVGAHKRHGWALPITAAVAAALPDWDALSIAFGSTAFTTVHRVWGHNLLVAGLLGGLIGWLGYLCYRSIRARQSFAVPTSGIDLVVWIAVGAGAGLSHLPADVIYPWPILPLWPFSERSWVYPIFGWGELGLILLFLGEMFVLYRWPRWAQTVSCLTFLSLAGYVALRWFLLSVGLTAPPQP